MPPRATLHKKHRIQETQRSGPRRPPLDAEEKLFLAILGTHLVFLPWAIGTRDVWSQATSALLALAGFFAALRVRDTSGRQPRYAWIRLIRFPLFWLGALFLAYVAVQGLNPFASYEHNATYWWVIRTPHISWLPCSVAAPFGISNVWRQLLKYAAAWLVTCSARIGITHRRSYRVMLTVIAINALTLALVLFYQRATNTTSLPSFLDFITERNDLTSTFVYHNHIGAYLALAAMVTVALATASYDASIRAQKKSSPAVALALFAVFLCIAVVFTLSRAATLILAAEIVASAVWLVLRRRRRPLATPQDSRIAALFSAIFFLFILFVVRVVDLTSVSIRFDSLIHSGASDPSISQRLVAMRAASDMFHDYARQGVGAGCFQYIFPRYQANYPEIYQNGRLYWDHLHNDWIESILDLGEAGGLILGLVAIYSAVALLRMLRVWYSSVTPVLFACLGTLAHAWMDFPFQNSAILVTWCTLLTLTTAYLRLDTTNSQAPTLSRSR